MNRKINKIIPQGFCKGVVEAINIINKLLERDDVKQPIYMLGNLVHNENITNAFKEKGIIILDGKPRIELLEEIESGTVIFTAHGVGDRVVERALEKGLDVVDATCKDVTKTHEVIKDALAEGKKVLYYGKQNHPETEGTLLTSEEIILIEDNFDIEKLPKITGEVILTNQTTMSFLDVILIYERLLEVYPQLELVNEICSATRVRQQAVINKAKNSDLVLIVGDPRSNNTQKLLEIASENTDAVCLKIQTVEDLNDIDLDKFKAISITAGASTPRVIVDEIIDTLNKYPNVEKPFKTKLKGSDYLSFRKLSS